MLFQARRDVPLALAIAVTTFLIFADVRSYDFINLDDPAYVINNGRIRDGLTGANVRWALLEYRPVYWHPLTWLSYLADVEIFGAGPRGHHITNLALHSATAALVFVFMLFLGLPRSASVLAGLIFGVHPLHVESFAWIAERKDVLSGLLFFATLIAWLRFVRSSSGVSYAASIVLFAAACASKPMVVTLPFVLLILDWWPLRRAPSPRLLIEKLPFFAMTLATSIATYWAQWRVEAVHGGDVIPLSLRAMNAAVSVVSYVWKSVLPSRLAVFYPYRYDPAPLLVTACIAVIAGITLLAYLARRRAPELLAGWLWFGGMLFPVIGLVQAGNQSMADRFMYLPLTGLLIMSTAAWRWHRRVRSAAFASAVVAVVLFAIGARTQLAYWRDSITLFTRTIAVTPPNSLAETCLGLAHMDRGNDAEARRHLERAVSLGITRRTYAAWVADAYGGLGLIASRRGDDSAATFFYGRAVRLRPDESLVSAYARALDRVGSTFMARGDRAEAIRHFSEALRRSPKQAITRVKYAILLADSGAVSAGLQQLGLALNDDPQLVPAHVELALLLDRTGRTAEARQHLRRSIAIDREATRQYFLSRTGENLPSV